MAAQLRAHLLTANAPTLRGLTLKYLDVNTLNGDVAPGVKIARDRAPLAPGRGGWQAVATVVRPPPGTRAASSFERSVRDAITVMGCTRAPAPH